MTIFQLCAFWATAAFAAKSGDASDQPTPATNPALVPPRSGVYCRGSACRYGDTGLLSGTAHSGAATTQAAAQAAKAALAIGMDALLGQKEFCRGLTCVDGMGHPLDRTKETFVAQCAHLFKVGGLEGSDGYRTVKHVYDSFGRICGPRVGNAEMPFCQAYADAFVAALSPSLEAPSVGSVETICGSMFEFMLEIKQAQIDLKLFEGSVTAPPDPSAVGPSSPRGVKWANFVRLSTPKPLSETHGDEIVSLQANNASKVETAAAAKDPSKYEITMASWDGVVKPTKVPTMLFDYCEAEMNEIMMNEPHPAGRVSKLAVDWCNFQQLRGGGRLDWTERTCIAIGKLFAFALRNIPDPPPPDQPPSVVYGALPKPAFGQMSPTMPPTYTMMPTIPDPPKFGSPPVSGPVSATMSKEQMQRMLDPVKRFLMRPDQVCQQLFVAIGATTRTEGILRNSYKTSFRVPSPGMGLPTKADAMLSALQQASDARESATKKKKEEEDTLQADLKAAKAAAASYDASPTAAAEPKTEPAAELPQSSDFNPQVSLAKGSFLSAKRRVSARRW